jgi:hypothetical protein
MSETLDFTTSEQTDKLDAAMAKAQSEIQKAHKDSVNPHFRSKFADLSSVWEACRDALTKNGISVTQWPVGGEPNVLYVVTRLAKDGQWIKSRSAWPVQKGDCQGVGSALTYARRYTLCAAVGVVADEDDDGNAASRSRPRQTERVDSQGEITTTAPRPAEPVACSPEYNAHDKIVTDLVNRHPKLFPTYDAALRQMVPVAQERGYHTPAALKKCKDPGVFAAMQGVLLVQLPDTSDPNFMASGTPKNKLKQPAATNY